VYWTPVPGIPSRAGLREARSGHGRQHFPSLPAT